MFVIDTKNLKLVRYRRKSTDTEDKQVASLEDQQAALDEFGSRFGITTSHIVNDIEEARSAKSAGSRPKFEDMVHFIKRGHANAIIAWHADRLSRNLGDVNTLIELLEKGHLVAILTPQHIFGNTPIDKFLLANQCLQAKFENDNKGVNVKRGLGSKVRKGWRPGPAPPGYLNDKTKDHGNRDIYKDPVRFPLVRQMWELLLTENYRPSQIREIANNEWKFRTRETRKQGGRPITMSMLYRIFHDPFYYGWYWWKNPDTGERELVKGAHEPMITKVEYDRAQAILGENRKPQPQTKEFAYTGKIKCGECDCAITAEEKHQLICTGCKYKFAYLNRDACPKCGMAIADMQQPTTLKYTFYRCTKKRRDARCSQKYIRLEDMEQQIDQELAAIEINEHYLKLALDYLNEKRELQVQDQTAHKQSLQEAHRGVEARIRRLHSEYMSSQNADYGLYTPEEFRELKAGLLQERGDIEERMKTIQAEVDRWYDLCVSTFNFCAYARYHFAHGDIQTRREILSALGSNLILTDKILSIEARKPYLVVRHALETIQAQNAGLEPEIYAENKGLNGNTEHAIPNWLRSVEAVRTYFRENSERKFLLSLQKNKSVVPRIA